jgi:hypothetical protein
MPSRVLAESRVQPAEVPALVTPSGVPAGRVPTTKVASSGVAAASVLGLCGNEETNHGQEDRKDARRSHEEGKSSGHGLPTPGESNLYFTPARVRGHSASTSISVKALFSGVQIPVSRISPARGRMHCLFFLRPLVVILFVQSLCGQERSSSFGRAVSSESAEIESLGYPSRQQVSPPEQSGTSSSTSSTKQSDTNNVGQVTAPVNQGAPPQKQQPKRILGVMPNFRAVSAGALPPPPTPKQAFKIATQNSFDYSSFIFVGITSALAEWTVAHPQLGQGLPGYGRYYWRGFVDKTDGNYLVIFALPTVFHQDERYYALGKGSIWKRGFYAASRIAITPDYHGHNSFNVSELLGRGIAQGISVAYYPSGSRTAGALATKYAYAIGRDALTNVFREFWPDIATHVLHRSP